MKITDAAVLKIAAATIANNGGTFDANGSAITPTDGYAVSLTGGEIVDFQFGLGDRTRLASIVEGIETGIAGIVTSSYIGTWIADDKLYVDPVVLVYDYFEAVNLAKAHNQLAIYGFAEGEAIVLEPAPTAA